MYELLASEDRISAMENTWPRGIEPMTLALVPSRKVYVAEIG
jgi:hypothetical protein